MMQEEQGSAALDDGPEAQKPAPQRAEARLSASRWSPALARRLADLRALRRLPTALELVVLAVWALIVAHPLLDLNPDVIPAGNEFLSAVQSHHIWTLAPRCGPCVMWNGAVRGGAPAFAETYGSVLHPLVILFTLGWGVVNGAKLAMVAALLVAGVAQLWLGAILGLGRLARLWGACMAIAAGHVAGRAEIGTFGLVLSTAACSLVLPLLMALATRPDRRTAVLLGLVAGQALLAGQGYIQVGLALSLPLVLVLVPWRRAPLLERGRLGLLAAIIALLLAAPLLVPLFHFLPQFAKDTDPGFSSGQPFAYVPLNLVIDDPDFYRSTELHKLPYPYLYVNYIGWVSVALATLGLFSGLRGRLRRETVFLGLMALFAMWLATGRPFAFVASWAPEGVGRQLASLRYFPVMAGLAVPPILALAALGLDRALRAAWPRLQLGLSAGQQTSSFALDLRWALLPPLLAALYSGYAFAQNWLYTKPANPEVPQVIAALTTPTLEWVNAPFGEHAFVAPAAEHGLKLGLGVRPWNWNERPLPPALFEAYRGEPPPELTPAGVAGGVPIYRGPLEREYARVVHEDGSFSVCSAGGAGGDLDIRCEAKRPGRLVVYEYTWSGWNATVDGRQAPLRGDVWLELDLPAGVHNVALRYRPWDAPLGLALCLAGLVLAQVKLSAPRAERPPSPPRT